MSDRVIKFRAWCLDMSKTGYYEYFDLPGDLLNTTIGISRTRIQRMIAWEQFTGLHDKDGTDIYEGDILDWGAWDGGDGERCLVEYNDEYAAFAISYYGKHGREGYEPLQDFIEIRKSEFNACGKCGTIIKSKIPLDIKVIATIHDKDVDK